MPADPRLDFSESVEIQVAKGRTTQITISVQADVQADGTLAILLPRRIRGRMIVRGGGDDRYSSIEGVEAGREMAVHD